MGGRFVLVFSIVVLVFSFALAACAQPAATPTAAPAPTAAPTKPAATALAPTAAPAKEATVPAKEAPATAAPAAPSKAAAPASKVTIRAAHSLTAQHPFHEAMARLKTAVESRTNGALIFELYPAGSLVGGRDTLEALSKGVVEAGWLAFSYWPSDLPVSAAIGLVPFAWDWSTSLKVGQAALPTYTGEMAKFNAKPLMLSPGANEWFMAKPVDVDNPSWQGRRIRAAGGTFNLTVQAFGGAAVSMAVPEIATALRTGVIDGFHTGISNYVALDLISGAPNLYNTDGFIDLATMWAINQDFFNRLPADQQQIISEEAQKAEAWLFAESAKLDKDMMEQAKAKGAKVNVLTPAQRKAWKDKLQPVYDAQQKAHGSRFAEWLETVKKITGQ